MSNNVQSIINLFYNSHPTAYIEHTLESHLHTHVDHTLIDQMTKGRQKGYHSWWHNQRCSKKDLHQSLQNAVDRGDYSTAMIFASMLDFRAKNELELKEQPNKFGEGIVLRFNRLLLNLHEDYSEEMDGYELFIVTEDSVIDENMVMQSGDTFEEMLTKKVTEAGLIGKPYEIVCNSLSKDPKHYTSDHRWSVVTSDKIYKSLVETYVVSDNGFETITHEPRTRMLFAQRTDGKLVLQGLDGPLNPLLVGLRLRAMDNIGKDQQLCFGADINDVKYFINKSHYWTNLEKVELKKEPLLEVVWEKDSQFVLGGK